MLGCLAGGADDLVVALLADKQDVVVLAGEPLRLVVHLRDQRAGRVDGAQPAPARLGVHARGDAVRGEHHDRSLGHLVGLFDEDRAASPQRLHRVPVVHDLLADVNGCTVQLERPLHGLHRPVHPGAGAVRRGKQDTARRGRPAVPPVVQVGDRLQDPGAHLGSDVRLVVEDPGHRLDPDAGERGDVLDRRCSCGYLVHSHSAPAFRSGRPSDHGHF